MNRKRTAPIAKFWKLALALAMFLALALYQDQAIASGPCDPFPRVCRYTFDPVENCCIADPRFDCYDVCF